MIEDVFALLMLQATQRAALTATTVIADQTLAARVADLDAKMRAETQNMAFEFQLEIAMRRLS